MSTDRFDLYFRGELYEGHFADFVKVDMARLFKVDLDRIEPYFSGEPQTIKLDVDRATAAKYQRALKEIGARLVVVPQGKRLAPSPAQHSTRVSPPPTETGAAKPWSVLPAGSDIGEHREVPPVAVDTSGLSLAEAGVDLVDNPVRPEPVQVDISGLTLDEPGADLTDGKAPDPPPAPDTSHLTLE
ncbi:MAG: hypothetical protein ACX931_14435 [Saccharospirillum sp.]